MQSRIQQEYDDVIAALKEKDYATIHPSVTNVKIMNNDKTSKWYVLFTGQKDTPTPLAGGKYCISIQFGPKFPDQKPKILMLGKFQHYHVFDGGSICHPLINKWSYKTTMSILISDIIKMLHGAPTVGDEASIQLRSYIDKQDTGPNRFNKYNTFMREQAQKFKDKNYF